MTGVFPTKGVAASLTKNAIAAPGVEANCSVQWYGPSCNPRLDPFAMNAVMSEIINAVNCADLDYDCSRLDNLCLAIKKIVDDTIHGCLTTAFPDATGSCAVEFMVLATDAAGCRRFARYSEASTLLGTANTSSVWPAPNTQVVPATPGNPATFYNIAQVDASLNGGPPLQESILIANRILRLQINVPCANTRVNFNSIGGAVFDPSQNGGNGAFSVLFARVDGAIVTAPGPIAARLDTITNYEGNFENNLVQILSAGVHTFELFIAAAGAVQPPAQVPVFVDAAGNSAAAVRATILPA